MENKENNNKELSDLLSRQTKAIENIEKYFSPAREEKRFEKLKNVVIKSFSGAAIVFTGALGLWELGVYLKETWETRELASNYANVGIELYYKENNTKVAKEFLEKAIELSPDNTDFRFLDAYIDGMASVRKMFNLDRPYTAEELNETYQALAKSVLLEQQNSNSAEPFILKGQIYAALKDNSRAKKSLEKAISKDPLNDFAYMRLGVVEYNSKNTELAKKHLNKSIELNPNNKWAYLWNGIIDSDSKKIKSSLEWFEKSLKLDPRFDLAYYNIGWINLKTKPKNYKNAENNFRKAISLNPNYKEAYYGLGMVYGYQNQYNVAESYLRKAVEIDEKFLTGWKWKGIVNYERKEFELALNDFSKALELDPSNSNIFVRRARVFTFMKQFDRAIDDLLLAKKFNDKNPRIHFYLANIYKELKKYEIAINSIDDALKLKKNYPEVISLKGDIYFSQNKNKLAEKNYSLAIDKASYRKERFLIKRAQFFFETKKYQLALKDFQSSRQLNKNYSKAWLGEVNSYIKLNNKNGAKKALTEYTKLKPNSKIISSLKSEINELK